MALYQCPLCKQDVSVKLYEQITGIWKEREEKLKTLRDREKQLRKKAADVAKRFEAEKTKLLKAHQVKLAKEKDTQKQAYLEKLEAQAVQTRKMMEKAERQFSRRLKLETTRLLTEQKKKQKEQQQLLKLKLEKASKVLIEKAQKKLQRDKKFLEKERRLQKDRHEKLVKQYRSFEAKKEKELGSAQKKIALLEEQVRKGQTPQMLGLLEEKIFLTELKKSFPDDTFEHTGKGGDIVHYVHDRSNKVGCIVYELKKVSRFSSNHISQTRKAKSFRQADYGILVTNAKRPKAESSFFVEQGVIVIHPTAALVLIGILRSNLIQIAKLSLGRQERDKTIKAVMEYIQGPQFANSISDIVQDTIDLYGHLKKEVVDHTRNWQRRLEKYRSINSNANKIDRRVIKLLIPNKERKQLPATGAIQAIELPDKIK